MALRTRATIRTTWTIDDFPQINNSFTNHYVSPVNNEQIRFELRIYPKNVITLPDREDVCVYLRLVYTDRPKLRVKYKVAVVDEQSVYNDVTRREEFYAQEYLWTFDQTNMEHYSKFISREQLLNPANKMLDEEDSICLYCRIHVIDDDEPPKIPMEPRQRNLLQISTDLGSLLETKKFCDFTLRASGKEFSVHKAILVARSPVFAAMLQHETKENQENAMEITDLDQEVCQLLINYLYTGWADSLDQFAVDLLEASDKYQIDSLKRICEEYLSDRLETESVASIFIAADMYQAVELKKKCVAFIKDNFEEVKKSESWKLVSTKADLLAELIQISFAHDFCDK